MNVKEINNTDLKVSIIMSVYKARTTIEQAVASVVTQSYNNWELIIINDACPEDSCRVIRDQVINSPQIIQIENATNQGVVISRNTGIAQAKGQIIAFLDSDDYWDKYKLERQITKIEEGYDLVCSNYIRVKPNANTVEVKHKEEFSFSDMLKSNQIGNLTGMYRCDLIGKIYQKQIGHEDYLMWLEIVKLVGIGYCVQEPLAYYRVSNKSLSSNKFRAASWQWYIYRKELKLSLITSLWFFSIYVYEALKKR
ncbi:glycosyltransferase involved in cell wall biosynthesis [Psychrobacter immobilis]|jgi:glycosyltransferase involved in cell wall biosynthesis|uniref:Glycosyltransferase involved in cell wall biosynthesis n=1 Tax=Psychrobacter immobilis TaxID=498 RepID=A0A2V1ZSM6_PSYIM|nr:glycosyltransferase family 2 protein [Psychrobacter immobilis]PWK06886.1 glycosyltransferase involved in cell wall biosynthesis [Psychrobacter immobilis]